MSVHQHTFALAIEAIAITAGADPWGRWQVSIRTRRQGEDWQMDTGSFYSHLTTNEMLGALAEDLEDRFTRKRADGELPGQLDLAVDDPF